MLVSSPSLGMNIQEEIKDWSDGVLNTLVMEEGCSDQFRAYAKAELESRPDTMVVLTSALLHSGATGGSGWTKKQLAVLGVGWPAEGGWLQFLCGKSIPMWQWKKFLSLKGVRSKSPLPKC